MLDADIYGPSQPKMLGASGQPVSADGKTMEPMESLGLQINSIGFMIEEDDPMIWRGPMAAGALQQLITQTNWHDLDYLIVDMPPGTGDIQLTLSQQVPLTGAVVVTTPQDIALIDAKKGLRMFQKVNVPILGIIENMSVFICPHCGEVEHIFGEGGAKRMSEAVRCAASRRASAVGQDPRTGRQRPAHGRRRARRQGGPDVPRDGDEGRRRSRPHHEGLHGQDARHPRRERLIEKNGVEGPR